MRKLLALVAAFAFISVNAFAQRTITGKVTDESGAPLANASVQVKNTNVGTATRADGTFTLSVPANASTLVISSVNMLTQEIAIGSQSVINASLALNASTLETVVVTVPYGTIKKTAFTGSEGTVTAKSIEKQQVTSVTKALEGLVPGILTTNGGGTPGSGAGIVIRGFSSVNGSSAPLYVVNGVPYDGSISSLGTDDIESVTVLKDAAAAALYGSRAAGGVIMITTKAGKRGKPDFNVAVRQSYLTRGIPEYDRVGPKEYYELMWEATRNSFLAQGQTPTTAANNASAQLTDANHLVYNAYNVPANQLVDPNTGLLNPSASLLWNESWSDELFRTASRTNVNMSVSGASDKTNYRLSLGYLDEDGIMIHTNYKRYNFRADIRTQANKWFNAGVNVDGAYSQGDNVIAGGSFTSNPFYYSRNMGPIYPVYQHNLATGEVVLDANGKPMLDWGVPTQMGARPYAANSNLVGSLALDDRNFALFNGNANTFGEITFLKDFSFKTTLGINLYDNRGTTYQNNQFGDAQNVQGRSTKSSYRSVSITLNEVLTWNRTFGEHDLTAMAGHESYKYQDWNLSATRIGFQYPDFTDLDNATSTEGAPSSNEDNYRIESYFGRVNYSFRNKYLASASVRRDGTSRFSPDTRWGNFYSAGIGWRISQEDFLSNVSWLNELKLKASYGQVGNQNIGGYYNYNLYYYADGFGNYLRDQRILNPSLVWESQNKFNAGFDFAIFSNRFQGSVEYFDNRSSDLLFDVPVSITTGPGGAGNIYRNAGEVQNTGLELQLGYNVIRKKDFDWRADLNFTWLKNEITKLPEEIKDGFVDGNKKWEVGRSIYDFWLREYAGVDASNGDALWYKDVLDANGKPTGERVLTNNITQASYYFADESAIPDFYGGLTNSFRYKNFDLSFLITFSYGGKFYDGNYAGLMHAGSYGSSWHADIAKRWKQPGDVTDVPRIQNAVLNQEGASTRFLFDGSYANIKNVNLSYTFSKTLIQKLGISGAQITATVDNVYLFTSKKGMDPQRSFTGNSDASYVPYRTFTVGINLNL